MVIIIKCTLGVFIALAFAADFLLAAPEFYQRTHRVRLKNLGTSNKKIFSQNQVQKDSESTLKENGGNLLWENILWHWMPGRPATAVSCLMKRENV